MCYQRFCSQFLPMVPRHHIGFEVHLLEKPSFLVNLMANPAYDIHFDFLAIKFHLQLYFYKFTVRLYEYFFFIFKYIHCVLIHKPIFI